MGSLKKSAMTDISIQAAPVGSFFQRVHRNTNNSLSLAEYQVRVIWSQAEKAAHNATLLNMWVEESEE